MNFASEDEMWVKLEKKKCYQVRDFILLRLSCPSRRLLWLGFEIVARCRTLVKIIFRGLR